MLIKNLFLPIVLTRFLLFILVFSLFSCKKENMGDCFKSTGKMVEEVRAIEPFKKIHLHDNVNLYITYSNEYSLKVKAGKNLQSLVETKVKNKILKIENKNKCNWVRSFKKDIDVYISTPTLDKLNFYGSGDVKFLNEFVTNNLLIDLWESSGDVEVYIDAKLIELKINVGTGTIKCMGEADELVAFMGSVGFVDASATTADKVLAVNKNSGYIKVNAQQLLTAEITGNGNIEYNGDPTIELIDIGKGELIKR